MTGREVAGGESRVAEIAHAGTHRERTRRGAGLRTTQNYTIDPARNVLTKARFSLPVAMALLYAMDIVIE